MSWNKAEVDKNLWVNIGIEFELCTAAESFSPVFQTKNVVWVGLKQMVVERHYYRDHSQTEIINQEAVALKPNDAQQKFVTQNGMERKQ